MEFTEIYFTADELRLLDSAVTEAMHSLENVQADDSVDEHYIMVDHHSLEQLRFFIEQARRQLAK